MAVLKIKNADGTWTYLSGAGQTGEPGYTPVKGTDYWTEEDVAEIHAYIDELILGGEY